ncbi:hypothetical protein ACPXCE_10100 [Streptomyces sp. DT24]|uniref:hypothetical protein n=1 Tax=Streptomyces sp. DT24 TaxID=3416520 RepID=UPI003CF36979
MHEFLNAAFTFPAVLFGAALVVVIAFWLLVLLGAAEHDAFDTDLDADAVGVGGVPVTVSMSLMVLIAWFTSLTGSILLHRAGATGGTRAALATLVLGAALLIAWGVVRSLVHHFRRRFPAEVPPSRQDFIGQVCMIRTGSVSSDFGQAEVTSADGSTAIVQVRRLDPHGTPGGPSASDGLGVPDARGSRAEKTLLSGRNTAEAPLGAGSTGLLYAYDDEGEFFWVAPYDAALDPGPSVPPSASPTMSSSASSSAGARPLSRAASRRSPRRPPTRRSAS